MKFLYKYWAKAGAAIAVLLLLYVYVILKNHLPILEKFILLNLAFLMLHQFEEYVYPGGFQDFFNHRLYNPMGFFRNKLTDKGILWVNVFLGWGMNILVYLFFKENAAAVLAVITILLINGLLHFLTAFSQQSYNPGVVTGAVLFIPLGFYSYYKLSSISMLNSGLVITVIIISIIASLFIPVTIYLTRANNRH
jgi:hypothetical protein